MAGIFICYRRDDSAGYAGRLYDSLALRFGEDLIFMDVDTIPWGRDYVDVVQSTLTPPKSSSSCSEGAG